MALRISMIALLWLAQPAFAQANGFSLFAAAEPLLASAPVVTGAASPSLFSGTSAGSFFAPLPPRAGTPLQLRGSVAQLLGLIAQAEAGAAGYDAINGGARIRTPRPPTLMTLGEIYAWIAATPGQPHAIGRYQFIPETLRRVARLRGYNLDTRFTPDVQDALAMLLLEEAGLDAFQSGDLDRGSFMRNLAQIWAGLPLPNGRSYYHGHAGNRATMTWEAFETGLAQIWPVG